MDVRQGFLIALILVVLALAVMMLTPFLGYIVSAGILGYLLQPVQEWLAARVGDTPAAGLIVILTVGAIIGPLFAASLLVVDDAQQVIQGMRAGNTQMLDRTEQLAARLTGEEIDLQQQINDASRSAIGIVLGNAATVIQQAAKIGIGLSVLLFLEFYALRDGPTFVAWLQSFDVLPADMQQKLLVDIGDMIAAVVKGHIFVAIIQAAVAGIGLVLTGIPNAAFWTFIMVLTSLVPVVGAIAVWGPAALYLIATGAAVKGSVLLLYGVIVVGFTDNLLRPILVDEEHAHLHEAFILIGVVGGILVFGVIGLFVGPVIFGLLNVLLTFFRDQYDRL